MTDASEKRGGRALRLVLKCVLALALVALCVEGTLLWSSYQRIAPVADQLQQDSDAVDAAVEAGDVGSMLTSLASIDSGIDSLQAELARPEWDVVTWVPVLGQDVRGARSLLAVGKDVMTSTVMPVHNAVWQTSALMRSTFDTTLLQVFSTLMGGGAANTSAVEQLVAMLGSVDGALTSLESSHIDIDADKQVIDSLEGTLHFSELVEARDRLAETLTYLSDLLDQAQPVLDGYAGAKATASSAANAAGEAASQVGAAVGEAIVGAASSLTGEGEGTSSASSGEAEASSASDAGDMAASEGSGSTGGSGEGSGGGLFVGLKSKAEKVGSGIAEFNQGVKDAADEAGNAIHETFSSLGEGISGLFRG